MPTALLIGASRGIGFELASQYIADGWRVIATARSDEGLERLKALGAQTLRVDVANPASNSGLAWQLDGEKIDLAIYVAGVVDRETTASPPTREKFDLLMHTNAMGPMMVLPQIAPMLAQSAGTFAVISSHFGSLTLTESSMAVLYRMSKAALNMYIRCAQHDFPEIGCVALHPGWVQTDMGGPQAPVKVQDSAANLRETLETVRTQRDPKHRGAFLNHDGSTLPW
ncbi:SDR family oxidoreductase [Limnohabitans sp.]|jgi:NAD(P)-dependent dehydrogenase (short-subunit alcohol dehydrogenase family)|uniref:SDR family oxidoreductase n=1 Tax=Limnohabitans sp. TaxID=1907725 RepID=UPI00334125CF